MDELIKYECKKFSVQVFKWLKMRYPDNVYDFLTLEDKNYVTMKIDMNVKKEFYEKKGLGIINYIIKSFRYPQNIYVNWRYNRSMFNINVFCGYPREEIIDKDD